MKKFLIALIKAYSFLVSPIFGQSCRFYPSCSAYAIKAIESHGALKGSVLIVQRILKCHPRYRGAYIDPVPEKHQKHKDCQP